MDSFTVTVKKFFGEGILTERTGNTKLQFGIEYDPPRGDEKHLGFHLNEPHLLSKEPRGAQLSQDDFPNSKINLACSLAMRSTGEDGKEVVRLLRECVEDGWSP